MVYVLLLQTTCSSNSSIISMEPEVGFSKYTTVDAGV